MGVETQVNEYLREERVRFDVDKENKQQQNKKKAEMLEDLQGMIKDYKKSA